jgi:predicted enzyme related to lactoylglutathione lyase
MKMTIAWFSVDDFEAAKQFYGSVLGMKQIFEVHTWAEFSDKDGGAAIGIAMNSPSGRIPGATVILQVDDIDAERRQLESKNVKFEGKTEEIPGIVKLATFHDPFGNRLQLCQALLQT